MKMDKIKCIKKNHYISGQIDLSDIEELANYGVKLIISNRPDNEELNQVSSKLLREKSENLGVKFFDIPFASGTLDKQKIIDFSNLIKNGNEKALFYCRSGARSAIIWGLASVLYLEEDLKQCMGYIENIGYDASMLPNMVEFYNNN